jgi:branched-chain amino acid transport system substrate-binding protein
VTSALDPPEHTPETALIQKAITGDKPMLKIHALTRHAALIGLCSLAMGAAFAAPDTAPLAAASADAQHIRIGVNCPFTGGSADMGVSMRAALRLITREINSVGGILGRPIELVEMDDQANPEVGKKVAEELIASKVLLTIGYCNSGVAAASIDVYQNAKVPLIIPVATATSLTKKFATPGTRSYIFRTAVPDVQQVGFMVDEILKRGLNKVAILADNSGYGEGGRKDVEAELARRNLKPVIVERFDVGVKDLKEALSRARTAGANVIFAYTVGPENAVISKSRAELKWAVPHVGPWTVGFGNHLSAAGPAAEGALMAQTFIQEAAHNGDRRTFIRNVSKEIGKPLIPCAMCAAQAYDAMQVAMRVIAQARAHSRAVTSESIRNELEALERPITGVVTQYEQPFSAQDHDAISRNMLVLGVVRNGIVQYADREDEQRSMITRRKQK